MMIKLQSCLVCVYVACGMYGLFSGPKVPLGLIGLANLVGTEYDLFSCAIGLNLFVYGFGVMGMYETKIFSNLFICNFIFSLCTGIPTMGCVIDYFNGFDEAFYITAIIFFTCALFNSLSELMRIKRNKNEYQPIMEEGVN